MDRGCVSRFLANSRGLKQAALLSQFQLLLNELLSIEPQMVAVQGISSSLPHQKMRGNLLI